MPSAGDVMWCSTNNGCRGSGRAMEQSFCSIQRLAISMWLVDRQVDASETSVFVEWCEGPHWASSTIYLARSHQMLSQRALLTSELYWLTVWLYWIGNRDLLKCVKWCLSLVRVSAPNRVFQQMYHNALPRRPVPINSTQKRRRVSLKQRRRILKCSTYRWHLNL